jgi:RNA polymerase sigma-70 factor (ECF subfamily)
LVLREVEGLSYEEISDVLEVSLGTVKSRILRGRESLRKHLVDRLQATPQVELPFALGRPVGAAGRDAV